MIFLVLINSTIFILLSFLHIYWALGGNRGMSAVIPSVSENQRFYKPNIYATFSIGGLMGLFALVTIGNLNIFISYIPVSYFQYATIGIGVIFIIRAVGDFTYIGFFKKATGTAFAKNDTRYYMPLCIIIAFISFTIAVLGMVQL
jgi:hypothetical protein